ISLELVRARARTFAM
ncbi:hypothetical protein C367_05143, partial [Cryptococcus neoformans Ze90-1]